MWGGGVERTAGAAVAAAGACVRLSTVFILWAPTQEGRIVAFYGPQGF